MQFSILKTLIVALGTTSSALVTPTLAPRSILALQGWAEKDFTGRNVYTQFCTADFCCNITAIQGYTEYPLRIPVLSVSTLDAQISLKKGAVATLWAGDECTGELKTFDPFTGVADLGLLTIVGSVSFVNHPGNGTGYTKE